MPEEKMTVVIDGYIIEYTVVDDMPGPSEDDPCLKRKLEEAKAFLRKHPHPWMTSNNAIVEGDS